MCVWLASGCGGIQLAFQGFDLAPDGFEFGFLALEESKGDAGFFFQPGGGEEKVGYECQPFATGMGGDVLVIDTDGLDTDGLPCFASARRMLPLCSAALGP